MKAAAKVAQSLIAVVVGGIGALGIVVAYVVVIAIAPLLVFLLIGGLFMMSPETRSELFFAYVLPWLLGLAVAVWLITGAVMWLVWMWFPRETRVPPAGALPAPPAGAATNLPDKV